MTAGEKSHQMTGQEEHNDVFDQNLRMNIYPKVFLWQLT